MCKIGCYALYENGYLSVEHVVVKTRRIGTDPPRITRLLNRLHDREFPEWTERRPNISPGIWPMSREENERLD